MIPSANSSWNAPPTAADSWSDQAEPPHSTAVVHCPGLDPRYLNLNRHQILDWENAMLLAHHSSSSDASSVYDQLTEYKPNIMQVDPIASLSHSRPYDINLLSANMNSNSSLSSPYAWDLLNTVCARSTSGGLQHENSLIQGAPYTNNYEGFNHGGANLGGYGNLEAAGNLYGDFLGTAGRSSNGSLGLTSFDQRRLEDIVKRELYTTHDFNSRLGLNLGGRTYFSADDFAFGRFGKRLRPNSPGCMMQAAPLCQAEGCKADLSMAKHYHRRHKVCEYHSKAATVHIGDQTQRFCQQCSRFHVLSEFDDGKRSCRKRLADHNRRRRKPQPAPPPSAQLEPEAIKEQDTTTCSDSLQNGAQSSKGSPSQAAEDQTIVPSASTTGLSSLKNINETSTTKHKSQLAIDEESMERIDHSKSSETPLKSSAEVAATSTSMAPIASVNQMAANLSLGGATDICDVRPAVATHGDTELEVTHIGSAPSAKHAVMMPWLHASPGLNQVNRQGLSFTNGRKSDNTKGDKGADHNRQYETNIPTSIQRAKASSFTDDKYNGRSSWMINTMATTDTGAKDPDGLIVDVRHAGEPIGDAGRHELLRLLEGERELLGSSKHRHTGTPMQQATNPNTGVSTLAFFDHPLNPSFDKHDQSFQFSSLQIKQPMASEHHQLARPLSRHSSNIIFGSHQNLI